MEDDLTNCTVRLRMLIILLSILIITIFFTGCAKKANSNSVICNIDEYSPYPKLVKQILPSFTVLQSDSNVYYNLDAGAVVEAFDTQAIGALESGIAKNWYPHYLATVIIAIDRDQTNALVRSWSDLYESQEEVGFFDTPGNVQMLTAAIAYGLEGEAYSLTKATQLLTLLNRDNRLKINSFKSPIIICYDYQATKLIKEGRNIEIIVAAEGTLTYTKGLLSKEKLYFEDNIDKLLLESHMRLLDGQSGSVIYPSKEMYASAHRVADYQHFARATQNASSLVERDVLGRKRMMSIDNFEHLLSALIYNIIIIIWIGTILKRSMQKGISYAAFFAGIILIGWTFVRLIRYQIELNPIVSRYLWYGFYIFQLALPLVLLWMAWAIDKPENKILPPKWWRTMFVIICLLIILVFTNDLHGLVLKLDLSRQDWDINYGYGFAYYIILFVCMTNLAVVFGILVCKGIRNPRKKGIIFPLVLFVLFAIYNYKYIIRDPFIYATDITIITGLFALFMFEVCMRSGLIPVNTKYIELFTRSPLKMQIINKGGQRVLTSASTKALSKDVINQVLENSPVSIPQDDETVLYANPIPGGHAIWHEDVSKIYQLQRDIQRSSQMLTEANAVLMEEKKLKRSINEENAKKQLMDQLELEIAESIKELTKMIEKLPKCQECLKETTRIALLLCYIKRRCNLFFQEKETNTTNLDQLIINIDELSEIAKLSDVQIARTNQVGGGIDIRHGRLFYDFFYKIADLAVQEDCAYLIEQFEIEEESFIMRLIPSKDIGDLKAETKLLLAIAAEKGKIVRKDLDDTMGINLSFPRGGG